jgi:hypothetical protein
MPDLVVSRSRAVKQILIPQSMSSGAPEYRKERSRDFGERDGRGARAATRLGEPAGCGSRLKEARAGVNVVMNVLNLCRHLQVRDEHDHRRATAIGLIVASGI